MQKEKIKQRVRELIKRHNTCNPFDLAELCGIQITYAQLQEMNGLYMKYRRVGVIIISTEAPEHMLNYICAHELGHASTGALHKVSSPFETVERSEHRANRWTAENILTEDDFREAFAAGYTEPWQLAEYFDLPEQDIMKAFSYWKDCRGIDFS